MPPSSTYTISGRVTVNGSGLAGVTLNVTGTGTGSAASDANGNYQPVQPTAGAITFGSSLASFVSSVPR